MISINNFSVKAKIYALLGLLLVVTITSSIATISALNKAENDADIINALGRQRMLTQAMAKSALGYSMDIAVGRAGINATMDEYKNMNHIFGQTLATMKTGGQYALDLKMTRHTGFGGLMDEGSQKRIREIETVFTQFQNSIETMLNAKTDSIETRMARMQILKQSNKLRKVSNDLVSHYIGISNQNQKNIFTSSIVSGVLILFIVLGIAWYLTVSVINRITQTSSALRNISEGEGDLTQRLAVGMNDELGELSNSANAIIENIQHIVRQVVDSSKQLTIATVELSNSSENTTRGVNQQYSEAEQVAAAMNEMTATVQEVASNAHEASEAAKQADIQVEEGLRVVSQVGDSINDLAGEVREAVNVIHVLETESDNIGSVLDVIKGIAEQTNLLALNAAIEAARAGEQGRGFAVVADEVRTLASRTQNSTQEIQGMIEKLQQGAKEAVRVMDAGHSKATVSVDEAKQAAETINKIATSVGIINDMNIQIASSAEEQSAVANEIDRNLLAVNDIASKNAKEAQQTANASETLKALTAELQAVVGKFKV